MTTVDEQVVDNDDCDEDNGVKKMVMYKGSI